MSSIIFKPLEICNSNCVYCDVVKKQNAQIMSDSLLELIFQRIDEYLTMHESEVINLTWHGGEISLLGPDYLIKAFELQNSHCKKTSKRIYHLIQSNLTKMTTEIIEAVKLLGVRHIGTSFEPIEKIRGYGKERDSLKYDIDFFKGVNLLEEKGISWGIIYVVHKKSLDCPEDIFHFLNNIKPNNIMFNRVQVDGHNEIMEYAITPREFADFLGKIFPYWYKYRNILIPVRPFDEFIEHIGRKINNNICERSGICTYKWTYIGPNGSTSQCGRCDGNKLISYGNIKDRRLDEVFLDKKRDIIQNRYKELIQNECMGCRFWGICHGGCPIDAYYENGSFLSKSSCCEWLKIFMTEYFEPITGMKSELYPDNKL